MSMFILNVTIRKNFFFALLFLIFAHLTTEAQTTTNCLSAEHLSAIYEKEVDHIAEFLNPPQWIRISEENDKILVIGNDTAYYRESVWQFTMSFSYISLKIYDNPNFDNVMLLTLSENCYQQLYNEFSSTCTNLVPTSIDNKTQSFLFKLQKQLFVLFTEKKETDMEYTVMYYNPIQIPQQAQFYKEKMLQREAEKQMQEINIKKRLQLSDSLFAIGEYENALLQLDSADFTENYESIHSEKRELLQIAVKNRDIALLLEEGKEQFEKEHFSVAKQKYEKILQLDSTNEIATEQLPIIEKKLSILSTRGSKIYDYEAYYSSIIDTIKCEIEDWSNNFIDSLSAGVLKSTITIFVDTFGKNKSHYLIDTFSCDSNRYKTKMVEIVTFFDSIVHFSNIKTLKIEDIFVQAKTTIEVELVWKSSEMAVRFNQKKIKLRKEDEFFHATIDSILFGSPFPAGKYQFTIRNKRLNEREFSDLSLKKIRFVGPEAALYSMLYPGVGTFLTTQGRHGIATMSAFTLFGSATILSYIYSRKYSRLMNIYSSETNDYKSNKMKSDLFMAGAYVGIGISGVIYISDVVSALVRGIDNYKKGKKYREILKNRDLHLEYEAIELYK